MNKFKYLSVVLFTAVLAGVVIVSCKKDDDDNPGEEGKKAGTEMCDCVSDIEEPNPPVDFDPQNPDFTNPEVLAYFAALEAYFGELPGCAGTVAGPYQKYFIFSYESYDEEIGLFSAFKFKDKAFEKGFLEATKVCADAFAFE